MVLIKSTLQGGLEQGSAPSANFLRILGETLKIHKNSNEPKTSVWNLPLITPLTHSPETSS